MRFYIKFLFLLVLLPPACLLAEDSTLVITGKNKKKSFSLSELLKSKDVETVTVESDPAYSGRTMKYKAIKATVLFDEIKLNKDAIIQFKTRDGFSGPIGKQRLLNTSPKKSIAYIALEPPNSKWPPLKRGKSSAGPFYLIWKNPQFSHIGQEEWPFMLESFEVKGSLKTTYPEIFPSEKLAKNHSISKGFRLFVQNCFACHTLNKAGTSELGPDLNVPMNPTEYFKLNALKVLIRNPQNVRHWPNSRMYGFDTQAISDEELNHLITYLKHMASRKLK